MKGTLAIKATLILFVIAGVVLSPARAFPPPDYTQNDYVFILCSEYDYTAGNLSLMSMEPTWEHDDCLEAMCGDAIARYYDGLIYIINRWGCDNIQVMDPLNGFETIMQFSTGSGSNPQDICVVGPNRAFVSLYEETGLWEVNPATGERTDVIDLAPLADPDGIPEMSGLAVSGNRLYVALERRNRDNYWLPEQPAYLAVIDLDSNTLLDMDAQSPGIQGIVLAASPYGMIITDPLTGDLLIGEVGLYGAVDGGVERIDPEAGSSAGLVVSEADLGGDLNVWTTAEGLHGFAVVIGSDWSTRVVGFEILTGDVRGVVTSTNEYAYTHLLVDPARGQLFVADRSYANPGLRIFSTVDYAPLTTGPIRVCLYPYWLLGMHGPDSGVDDWPIADRVRLEIFPQPATNLVSFRWPASTVAGSDLEILDVSGRVAARLATCEGRGIVTVDLGGIRLAAGAYVARLRTASGTAVHAFRVLR